MADRGDIKIPVHDRQPMLRKMGLATEPHPKDVPVENKARENSTITESPFLKLATQGELPPKVL